MEEEAGCGCLLVIVVFVIVIAVLGESFSAKTNDTVETVGHNTAHLEAGETMIVVRPGKSQQVWHITYDGNDAVKFDCRGCFDKHATLSGAGVRVEVDLGWGLPSFYVTRNLEGGVDVRWPDGWRIRR